MPSGSLDRDVEQQLVGRGVRYTKGRRAVVAALADADGPRSVAELNTTIGGKVPVSSLYRTLAVLEEAGIVVPHLAARSLTRYELAEWIAGHHHHVTCLECGAIEDIDLPTGRESQLRKLVDEIASQVDFTPIDHTLEIEGRCARCS